MGRLPGKQSRKQLVNFISSHYDPTVIHPAKEFPRIAWHSPLQSYNAARGW